LGVYRAEKADSEAIVLRHEGEDDHTIEVHAGISGAAGSGAFAPVPVWMLGQVQPGKRYFVSFGVSQVADPIPAPAEPVAEAAPASSEQPEQAFDAPETEEAAPATTDAPAPLETSTLPAWAVTPDPARTLGGSPTLGEADETTAQ
jgi:hypothetical protein